MRWPWSRRPAPSVETTESDWSVPRCEHGAILLACGVEPCADQDAYVEVMRQRHDAYDAASRDIVTALGQHHMDCFAGLQLLCSEGCRCVCHHLTVQDAP